MVDQIKIPFANTGDKSTPPTNTDPNGFVSFNQGYTPDYDIGLSSGDPQAKPVERKVQNYMFNLITDQLMFLQNNGFQIWFSGNTYGLNAQVMRLNNGVYTPYRSLVANNVSDPLNGAPNWEVSQSNTDLLKNIPMPAGAGNTSNYAISSNAALSTYNTDGTFYAPTDAIAQGINDWPVNPNAGTKVSGLLEVKSWTTTSPAQQFTLQRIFDRLGALYTRTKPGNGSFGPFVKVVMANEVYSLNGTSFIGSNVTLTAADAGFNRRITGNGSATTVTMPKWSEMKANQLISITNIARTPCTIMMQGSDKVSTGTAADGTDVRSQFVMQPGDDALLTVLGSSGNWLMVSGLANLQFSNTQVVQRLASDNSGAIASTSTVWNAAGQYKTKRTINSTTTLTFDDCGSYIQLEGNGYVVTLPNGSDGKGKEGKRLAFFVAGTNTPQSITLRSADPNGMIDFEGIRSRDLILKPGQYVELVGADTSVDWWTTIDANHQYLSSKDALRMDSGGQLQQVDIGKTVIFGGSSAQTITLPSLSLASKGDAIEIMSIVTTNGPTLTVTVPNGEQPIVFRQGNTPSSFNMGPGGTIKLLCESTAGVKRWEAVSGTTRDVVLGNNVTSFNGRSGDVTATAADFNLDKVTNEPQQPSYGMPGTTGSAVYCKIGQMQYSASGATILQFMICGGADIGGTSSGDKIQPEMHVSASARGLTNSTTLTQSLVNRCLRSTVLNGPDDMNGIMQFGLVIGTSNVEVWAVIAPWNSSVKFLPLSQSLASHNGGSFTTQSTAPSGLVLATNYKIFSGVQPPTPDDVGAVARAGDLGITGILQSTSEFRTSSLIAYRMMNSVNYTSMFYNDGFSTYCLLTNKATPTGSYNNLRPWAIDNATGNMTFGHAVSFASQINGNGSVTLNGSGSVFTSQSYMQATYTGGHGYADQFNTTAPFYNITPTGQADAFLPSIKQKITTQNAAYIWSWGGRKYSNGSVAAELYIRGSAGNDCTYTFSTNGTATIPGPISVGGTATYQANGDIAGPTWGGYLSAWLNNNLNTRVQAVRLAGRNVINDSGGRINLPSGAVYTGMSGANYDPSIWAAWSQLQYMVNGQWVNAWTA